MTTEELLKPRYKVIADYPFNNHFKIGEIIELNEFDGREHLAKEQQEWFKYQKTLDSKPHVTHRTAFYESTLNQYPHLFKPLQWWEEREASEMPEYVKVKGKVYKMYSEEWGKITAGDYMEALPATLDEYNNQRLNK